MQEITSPPSPPSPPSRKLSGKRPDAQSRSWSEEDNEYLANNWGLVTPDTMRRKLHRSQAALQSQASKLGVNRKTNYLNASEVGRQMGVDQKAVVMWITRGLLKGRKSCNGREGVKWWRIMPEDLERFVCVQVGVYDPQRITHPYLRQLARKHVPSSILPKMVKLWTPDEDAFLLNNHKAMTYAQIGKRLRRSKEAVHGRMVQLRKREGRKISYKAQWVHGKAQSRPWTQEEDDYLRGNWAGRTKGKQKKEWGAHRLTVADMCLHLDRTEHGVYTRARFLGLAPAWERKDRQRRVQEAA